MSERPSNIHLTRKVDAKRRIYEVRRETNEEIMHQALLERGKIEFRIVVQMNAGSGKWLGYNGLQMFRDVSSITEAREFLAELQRIVEQ